MPMQSCNGPATQSFGKSVVRISTMRIMENISFIFHSLEVISNFSAKENLNKKDSSALF